MIVELASSEVTLLDVDTEMELVVVMVSDFDNVLESEAESSIDVVDDAVQVSDGLNERDNVGSSDLDRDVNSWP